MFSGLSNLASLMKNAQQLQGRAQEMKQKLAAVRVTGTAGAGMVQVEANGEQSILKVSIEPSLFESNDRELLEELVAAATNQALELAREAAATEMATLAEGMGIPGLQEALSRFGLGT
jgi:DNA-binding YbaB/EbfC family protein